MTGSVEILFPRAATNDARTVGRLLAELDDESNGERLSVGDERVLDFLVALSRRLLQRDLARRHPELGSLGFFLRRSELVRAVKRLGADSHATRRVPRGLVLQFPPANVDTIFVYSWALSMLAGNRNIVRISARSSGAAGVVIDALNDVVGETHPEIARTQRLVRFEHDDDMTAELCAACDVRVIWGGDQAVRSIRTHPIPPLARDLGFPDRSSFAAISVSAWDAATDVQRRAAVEGFASDVYWFDQAACSSPRVLCWVGDAALSVAARVDFTALLSDITSSRGWGTDHAMAVEKRVAAYGLAATGAAESVTFVGNAIANVELAGLAAWQREWLGAGTICHLTIASLDELVPVVRRKDQTLSHFGFSQKELDGFVTALAGRGIDRIVPFGSALAFSAIWDGLDLLHEFTRIVAVQA